MHMYTHTGQKTHKCIYCPSKFTLKQTLEIHERTHTGENLFSCGFCNKTFSRKDNLAKHVEIHTQRKVFECPLKCGLFLSTKSHLARHMKSNHEQNKLLCPLCPQSFNENRYLKAHIVKNHHGYTKLKSKCERRLLQKFRCTLCNKLLAGKMSLKNHQIAVHRITLTKETCRFCNKSFPAKSYLKKHLSETHGNVNLSCPLCTQHFKKKYSLHSHIKFIHENSGGFRCHLCGNTYILRGNLNFHMKRKHGGQMPNKTGLPLEEPGSFDNNFRDKKNLNKESSYQHFKIGEVNTTSNFIVE